MLCDKFSLSSVLRTLMVLKVALATATHLRIIDGWADEAGDYPYVVRLESNSTKLEGYEVHALCTGTLLTNQWVITAAHCVGPPLTFVRYGNMAVPRKDANMSRVLKQITNQVKIYVSREKYKFINRHDIALLLIETIHTETIAKLSSVDYKSLVGKTVTIVGYGMTVYPIETMSEMLKREKRPLQIAEGLIFKTMDNGPYSNVKPSFLVAPKCSNPFQGALPWDSGGPSFVSGKVVGVTGAIAPATSGQNKLIRKVQIITPVSPYLNWIYDIIHEEKIKH